MFTSEIDRDKAAKLWDFGGVAYMNHGSYGACPLPLREFQRTEREKFLISPVDYFTDIYPLRFAAARKFWAEFTRADIEGMVLVEGATLGVNTVITSLALRGFFKPGDEILLTSHGYNACNNAVREITAMTGAVIVVAPIPFPIADKSQVTESVLKAVTNKTRLALIDHITSATALVYPIHDIVAGLKTRGVETLVDGAHAPAHVPIDLRKLGAAFYTGNGHKWLCAAPGCAFLHVREDFRDRIRPLNTSHGANDANPAVSAFQKAFAWPGTRDNTAWFTAGFAFDTLSALHTQGLTALIADNRRMALHGYKLLLDALGQKPNAPDDMLGCMATVLLPAGDSNRLRHDIRRRENMVTQTIGTSDLFGGHRGFRIAAHAYTTADQCVRTAKVLVEALAREQRGELLELPAA